MNVEQRFWAKVRKTSTCWFWQAGRTDEGYGRFWFEGRTVLAHRWAYEHWVGPISDGLTIDHKCRIRYCIRPAHLEPVTIGENVRRGESANRQKTHCPQGHPYSGDNLRTRSVGRGCRACDVESMKRSYQRKRLAITV